MKFEIRRYENAICDDGDWSLGDAFVVLGTIEAPYPAAAADLFVKALPGLGVEMRGYAGTQDATAAVHIAGHGATQNGKPGPLVALKVVG